MRAFNDCGIEQERRVFLVPAETLSSIQAQMQAMVGLDAFK
jgi:hypothetical protein